MRRAPVYTLIVFILVAIGSLTATLISGESPQLGLDLQGGASVVLEPREEVPQGVLDQAIEIIRNRVDALGVAEPEITRQGESIIVSLPGVENRERALQVVGQTAQLLFRPVIQQLPAEATPTSSTTTSSTTSTTVEPNASTTTTSSTIPIDLNSTTAPEDDDETKQVILPEKDSNGRVTARYLLGPAEVKGQALSDARATVQPTSVQSPRLFALCQLPVGTMPCSRCPAEMSGPSAISSTAAPSCEIRSSSGAPAYQCGACSRFARARTPDAAASAGR